jgi:beta-N-acetylhexosaminidase
MTSLKAIIVDASDVELTKEEEQLFKSERPAGFILFKRNCISKQQIKELVAAMRESVGYDVPVLIDQEGGSVSRLKAPTFREYPTARSFADLVKSQGMQKAVQATRENSRQMALDLIEMGITVNCAPVVDVPSPDCHKFLSESRTYGDDTDEIAALGEMVCRGLLDGGVTPVIKHIPGHGRAKVDSHFALPETSAPLQELSKTDFKPFKYLAQSDMKKALWAMAAHVVYSGIDPDSAATVSRKITDEIIRGHIGFEGVLLADDVSMKALGGTLEDRVNRTMAAGMDITMLCNAPFEDRVRALKAAPKLTAEAAGRIVAAERQRMTERKVA